jgi:hypothetical protein
MGRSCASDLFDDGPVTASCRDQLGTLLPHSAQELFAIVFNEGDTSQVHHDGASLGLLDAVPSLFELIDPGSYQAAFQRQMP